MWGSLCAPVEMGAVRTGNTFLLKKPKIANLKNRQEYSSPNIIVGEKPKEKRGDVK
jgi:hypothetical protein